MEEMSTGFEVFSFLGPDGAYSNYMLDLHDYFNLEHSPLPTPGSPILSRLNCCRELIWHNTIQVTEYLLYASIITLWLIWELPLTSYSESHHALTYSKSRLPWNVM